MPPTQNNFATSGDCLKSSLKSATLLGEIHFDSSVTAAMRKLLEGTFQADESFNFHQTVAKRRFNTPRKQRMWQQAGNSQATAWAKCRAREQAGLPLPDSLHSLRLASAVLRPNSETTDRRGLVPTQKAKAAPLGELLPFAHSLPPKLSPKEGGVRESEERKDWNERE